MAYHLVLFDILEWHLMRYTGYYKSLAII